ncbi:hypothetical protein KIW84_050092 [Lathyrus oleraceus]|uniref:Uncharacterized protein n=1 Tax=Pisum sativum TaxID=3888 RepID=A0A9D4WI88_PEA|nr:hypothetical protein KIW84_050092 [Pisum sativum]
MSLRRILKSGKLVGSNYDGWYRYLRIVLMHEKLIDIVDKPVVIAPINPTNVEATKTYEKCLLNFLCYMDHMKGSLPSVEILEILVSLTLTVEAKIVDYSASEAPLIPDNYKSHLGCYASS